jgi:chromosome segregation ATPase
MEECQRMTQTLRSEIARTKDRVLAVQAQNRDYAERAVDDARRLATQDEAIERLEHSVQAYQDERARLEAAYKQLASNLGSTESAADGSPSAASSISATRDAAAAAGTSRRSKGRTGEDDAAPPR